MDKHQAEAAKQTAWVRHWVANHTWSADGKTATPKPGWDWEREMEANDCWRGYAGAHVSC